MDGYIEDWQTAARLIIYAALAVEISGVAVCYWWANKYERGSR